MTSAIHGMGITEIRKCLGESRKHLRNQTPENPFYATNKLSNNMTIEYFALKFQQGHHQKRHNKIKKNKNGEFIDTDSDDDMDDYSAEYDNELLDQTSDFIGSNSKNNPSEYNTDSSENDLELFYQSQNKNSPHSYDSNTPSPPQQHQQQSNQNQVHHLEEKQFYYPQSNHQSLNQTVPPVRMYHDNTNKNLPPLNLTAFSPYLYHNIGPTHSTGNNNNHQNPNLTRTTFSNSPTSNFSYGGGYNNNNNNNHHPNSQTYDSNLDINSSSNKIPKKKGRPRKNPLPNSTNPSTQQSVAPQPNAHTNFNSSSSSAFHSLSNLQSSNITNITDVKKIPNIHPSRQQNFQPTNVSQPNVNQTRSLMDFVKKN